MMMQPISSELQSFISSLPDTTRRKLAVMRAQRVAGESSMVAQAIEAIRSGEICFEAARSEFGLETAKVLFDFAQIKVV